MRSIRVLNADAESRQELDENFLRSGFQRWVYASSAPRLRWKSRPRRSRRSLLLAPVIVDPATELRLVCLDRHGRVHTMRLRMGQYYYLPPHIPYEIEASGPGALEIFIRASRLLLRDEDVLPVNFFETHRSESAHRKETPMAEAIGTHPKKIDVIIINDEVETPSFLNPMTGQLLVSNRVGMRIVELADGTRSIEDIATEISRQFKGAPQAQIREEVTGFVTEASKKGLLTWHP